MAKVADTENIVIGDNAGKVGSENAVDVTGKSECVNTFLSACLDSFTESLSLMTTLTGGVEQNAALGNTSEIAVLGQNTDKARIGAENAYKIEGELLHIREEQPFIFDSLLALRCQHLNDNRVSVVNF